MRFRAFPALTVGSGLFAVLVVFFPVLFYGRVISPLDAIFADDPWRSMRNPVEVTNPELETAATVVLPLFMTAQRDGLASAVWSPYRACGGAGTLSWSDGLLSPFVLVLLPWLDPALLFNAMVLGKLLVAFIGTVLLLRHLGLSEAASAVGGSAYALSGPLAAHWLWPSSATTAVLPLLLWAADRAVEAPPGRLASRALVCSMTWLALLSGGAREEAILAALVTLAWIGWRCTRRPRSALVAAAGLALALAVLTPAIGLTAMDAPARPAGASPPLGWAALRLLVDPFAWGDPRQDTFMPPSALAGLGFRDVCLSVGILTAVLVVVGAVAGGRPRHRWTALLTAAVAILAWGPAAAVVGKLPGLGGLRPMHVAPLAALAAAGLAACGAHRLAQLVREPISSRLVATLAAAIALEQGLLAGHLLAYLPRGQARLECGTGLELARSSCDTPVRVAPLLDSLRPDTGSAFALEDLRSRAGAAEPYRRWLQTIDPQVWGHFGDMLRFNTVTLDLGHPYLHALGARFILEPPSLRLVEYALGLGTLEVEPRSELLGPLTPGSEIVQELELPRGCSRLGVHALVSAYGAASGLIDAELVDEVTAQAVGRWAVDVSLLAEEGLAWLDLQRAPAVGHRHRLILRSRVDRGSVWLRRTADRHSLAGRLLSHGSAVDGDLGLSLDTSGLAVVYDGPDLRVWEDRRAAPRFWVVHELQTGTLDELLAADPPLDLSRVAMVGPGLDAAWPPHGPERIVLRAARAAAYSLDVDLSAPGLMVSSVPAKPPLWQAHLDGSPVDLVTANGLFLALAIPAGHHRVELEARPPALWYVCSAIGGLTLTALAVVAIVARRREGRRS